MTALPSIVAAHQHGMGAKSYNRQRPDRPVTPARAHEPIETRYIDGKSEYRRIWDLSGGVYRAIWTFWSVTGSIPFRVYDIQGSTVLDEVMDDRKRWIEDSQNRNTEDCQ